MKCLWHIRTTPDFHWILPYAYYSSSFYKIYISLEDLSLLDKVNQNIKTLCPDMKYEIIDIQEVKKMSFDIGLFEWGIGKLSLSKYLLKRYVLRNLDSYRFRSLILNSVTIQKSFCLPHGYNVKYGNNLKTHSFFSKLKNFFSSTDDRLIFDTYYFDNYFHREIYNDQKLYLKSQVIDVLLLRREWLDRYPENDLFADVDLFFVPKLKNRIDISSLSNRIKYLSQDSNVVFVIHPREVNAHTSLLTGLGLDESRIVDLQGDIIPALKVCGKVYDVGSSVAMLCISLGKKYILERLTENITYLDDFTCGDIDDISSKYLYDYFVSKHTAFNQITLRLEKGLYFEG